MSRRHKEVEEKNKKKRDEAIGVCIRNVTDRINLNDNDNNQIITIKKNDEKCETFSMKHIVVKTIEKVANEFFDNNKIVELFCGCGNIDFKESKRNVFQIDFDNIISQALKGEDLHSIFQPTFIDKLKNYLPVEVKEKSQRGRPKITKLLKRFKDSEVCNWFKKIKNKLENIINNVTQFIVCFFSGLFDITEESPYGKLSYFYKMVSSNFKEKPTLRSIQDNYKWFTEKYRECKNKLLEEKKRLSWTKLYNAIKEHLIVLEPQLAMC